MSRDQRCIEAYKKHKHLKLAAEEVGIAWQTLYVILRRNDIAVTGDKLRYGSDKDRFAAKAEMDFMRLVPAAKNMNTKAFQAKFDFDVMGMKVEVKSSRLHLSSPKCKLKRWAFSLKKQESVADFMVCLAYQDDQIAKTFLLPKEIFRFMTTISISEAGGKWDDYEISAADLNEFFEGMAKVKAA